MLCGYVARSQEEFMICRVSKRQETPEGYHILFVVCSPTAVMTPCSRSYIKKRKMMEKRPRPEIRHVNPVIWSFLCPSDRVLSDAMYGHDANSDLLYDVGIFRWIHMQTDRAARGIVVILHHQQHHVPQRLTFQHAPLHTLQARSPTPSHPFLPYLHPPASRRVALLPHILRSPPHPQS